MKYMRTVEGKRFIIDNEDFASVKQHRWHFYDRYVEAYINNKTTKLSRFILNPSKEWHIDHRDGNTLNNRKNNLRLCSRSQNQWNRKINKDNVCGKKGVQLMSNGNYRVRVQTNGIRIHIGVYKKLSEAVKAREEYAREKHKEFYR